MDGRVVNTLCCFRHFWPTMVFSVLCFWRDKSLESLTRTSPALIHEWGRVLQLWPVESLVGQKEQNADSSFDVVCCFLLKMMWMFLEESGCLCGFGWEGQTAYLASHLHISSTPLRILPPPSSQERLLACGSVAWKKNSPPKHHLWWVCAQPLSQTLTVS